MKYLNRLYGWYGKRNVIISIIVIVGLLIAGIIVNFMLFKEVSDETVEPKWPQVNITRVSDFGSESSFRITGTVRAVSEAQLQTEASGRITSVNVELGDTVRAGAVLATIENSAQRAALLQAEGSYDSAVANAQADTSNVQSASIALESALTAAVNAYKSAFITADSSVRNTIDDLFTDPAGPIPGFRLDGFGTAVSLNTERTELEPVLKEWSSRVNSTNASNIESRLEEALRDIRRISRYAETLAALVARQDTSASFTQAEKDALEAEFVGVRTSLNQTAQALEAAVTAIENARETLQKAGSTTGTTDQLAAAQLKSALGSLRAAQSNYQKTIVRTPISGIVNALYLKAGDYASPSQLAVVIANNNALEITAFVNQTESNQLQVGQDVRIEDEFSGRITNIAPAIDSLTGKVEIKVQTESTELKNGDTVSIAISESEKQETTQAEKQIMIPITALKAETDRIVVFTVSDENTLVAHEIVEGPLVGSNIIIEEGITSDMEIVVDARGLNEGDQVEVAL